MLAGVCSITYVNLHRVHCPNPECGESVLSYARNCHVCQEDVGYPNIRAAEAESSALEARWAEARTSAEDRGCLKIVERFRTAVNHSKAVLCRSLGQVLNLVSSDNELYATFYGLVRAEARLPEDTMIERERLLADDLLFPHYKDAIRFAALSLNGKGVTHYGRCSVVLTDASVRRRATVFEKNSVDFCREHGLGFGNLNSSARIPAGYRAIWEERGKLAAAKVQSIITSATSEQGFPRVLLDDDLPDFVEVHIYGPLHRRAIESINISGGGHPSDEALMLEIERRSAEAGVSVGRSGRTENNDPQA